MSLDALIRSSHFESGPGGQDSLHPQESHLGMQRFTLISFKDPDSPSYHCVRSWESGYHVQDLAPRRFLDIDALGEALMDFDHEVFQAGAATCLSLFAFSIGCSFCVGWILGAALVATVTSAFWFQGACSELIEQHSLYQLESQRVAVREQEEEEAQARVRRTASEPVLSMSPVVAKSDSLYHIDPTPEQIAAKRFIMVTIAEGPVTAGLNQSDLKRKGALLKGKVHPLRQLAIVFSNPTLKSAMVKVLSFSGWLEKRVKVGYIGTPKEPAMAQDLAAAHARGDLTCHLEQFCTSIAEVTQVDHQQLRAYAERKHWENFLRVLAGLKPIR